MRLDRFICKSTSLMKEEAVRFINDGAVSVNGAVVVNEATQVHENNQVVLEGQRLKPREFRYLMMHKPPGTV
ncbi:MAG: S4 domain-containing protein, partial [Sedimenticola sp.]|nr:S4 domain-containing protein [Sedimenticola sp.]